MRLDRIVAPGGFVAVVCSRAAGSPRPWWYPIVERLVDKHVGPRRLAGPGQTYEPPQRDHEAVLRGSPFARLTRLTVDYTIDLPLARLVLAQLSYAFSSPAVLGDRQAAFVAELRDELRGHLPAQGDWQRQRFVARLQACVILGERDA